MPQVEHKLKCLDGMAFARIALVSDSHGPLHEAIAGQLEGYDCVVHAGDLGNWQSFAALSANFHAVRGNNDIDTKWPVSELRYLRRIPEVLNIKLRGGELVVIHGHQFPALKTRHARLREAYPQAKAILYGHSHRAVIEKSRAPWIINPGASGYKRTFGGAAYIRLTIGDNGWRLRRILIAD